jgi:hypothetical protein
MYTIKIDKIKFDIKNETKFDRTLNKFLGNELSNISKPCYFPKLNRYHSDINKIIDYDKNSVYEFQSMIPRKYKNFKLLNDQYTTELIILMLIFAEKKKFKISESVLLFLGIKFYGSIMHRMFPKFCNNEGWNKALNNISSKHLFKVKNGISTSISYLINEIFKKYKNKISKKDVDFEDVFKLVYEARHRIAQSVKSFAENYYKHIQDDDEQSKKLEESQLIADKISSSICTYNQMSNRALREACKTSSIKLEIAENIVSDMNDINNRNDLRFVLILIGRVDDIKNVCIDRKRNYIIRKIMEGEKISNYTIKDKILDFIYNLKNNYRYKNISKDQLVLFFSNYIMLFIKEKIC